MTNQDIYKEVNKIHNYKLIGAGRTARPLRILTSSTDRGRRVLRSSMKMPGATHTCIFTVAEHSPTSADLTHSASPIVLMSDKYVI